MLKTNEYSVISTLSSEDEIPGYSQDFQGHFSVNSRISKTDRDTPDAIRQRGAIFTDR
jgi:hypothetical protein